MPDVLIDSTWQSLNALSGITTGQRFSIQNKSTDWIYVADNGQPSADSTEGYLVAPFDHTESSYILVTEGSPEIWVRSGRWQNTNLFVQEI